jgi:hypothetical protein
VRKLPDKVTPPILIGAGDGAGDGFGAEAMVSDGLLFEAVC